MNAAPMVGFFEAIKLGFKNYVNFEDRSRRSEYWYFILLINLITIVTFTLMMVFLFVPKKVKVKEIYHNYYNSYYYSNSYNNNYSQYFDPYYSNYSYNTYYNDYDYYYCEKEFYAMLSIFLIYHSAIIIPFFAAGVRRLHDIGKSGNYMFLISVPPFGWISLIVLLCLDSNKMANGVSPKYFNINQIRPLSTDTNLPKDTFPVPASSVDIR